MNKIGFLLISVLILAGIASASSESILKAGVILNKADEEFYSWIIIHETSYFIKDLISIGYETQFSFYKFKSFSDNDNEELENNAFPLNIFFNSKMKVLRKGIIRPYVGAGFGLLTNIINSPNELGFEKYNAFHVIGGINIGKNTEDSNAAFQIEFRLLSSNKKESSTKFLLLCGIQY